MEALRICFLTSSSWVHFIHLLQQINTFWPLGENTTRSTSKMHCQSINEFQFDQKSNRFLHFHAHLPLCLLHHNFILNEVENSILLLVCQNAFVKHASSRRKLISIRVNCLYSKDFCTKKPTGMSKERIDLEVYPIYKCRQSLFPPQHCGRMKTRQIDGARKKTIYLIPYNCLIFKLSDFVIACQKLKKNQEPQGRYSACSLYILVILIFVYQHAVLERAHTHTRAESTHCWLLQ